MRTKTWVGLWLLLLALLALAACGDDVEEAASDEPEADAAEAEDASDADTLEADEAADDNEGQGGLTVLDDVESVSVQTDWFASTDHAALYAAEHFGIFEEHNLDVEIREGGPGIRAANDVATGSATFGVAIPENVILANAEGVDLTTFFATYQTSPIGLMVHSESGAETVDDLRELAVQIFPGQVFWEVLKAEHDLDVEEIAFEGSLGAWLENPDWAVQAFATTGPYFAELGGADPVMLTADDLGFSTYGAGLFTSDAIAAEQPEVVRAFAEASQRGLEQFLEDPMPVIEYINAEVNEDFEVEVGEAATEVMRELVVSDVTDADGIGAMTTTIWDDLAARMLAAGVISDEVDAATLWTNEYLLEP